MFRAKCLNKQVTVPLKRGGTVGDLLTFHLVGIEQCPLAKVLLVSKPMQCNNLCIQCFSDFHFYFKSANNF